MANVTYQGTRQKVYTTASTITVVALWYRRASPMFLAHMWCPLVVATKMVPNIV